MLKKAAALLFVCASIAIWVGCGSTSSRYVYAAIPLSNQIVAYREDPNSGVLTQLTGSPVTAGSAVQSIARFPETPMNARSRSPNRSSRSSLAVAGLGSRGISAQVQMRPYRANAE